MILITPETLLDEAMARRRTRHLGKFQPKQVRLLDEVRKILDELADYLPLTLRQLYYQLVARMIIENTHNRYKRLSELLTKARECEVIPWHCLEDRSRTILRADGWQDKSTFLEDEAEGLLRGYRRDLLQSQPHRIELWCEKDALAHIAYRAASPYCVDVVAAKGFTSASYRAKLAERVRRAALDGKRTVILYCGDMDPSGWEMLPSMLGNLIDAHSIRRNWLKPIRFALNPDQIKRHALPQSIDALKWSDSRAKKYVQRFGEVAVELDALSPPLFERLVREAIEGVLDKSAFAAEQRQEEADRAKLETLRNQTISVMYNLYNGGHS